MGFCQEASRKNVFLPQSFSSLNSALRPLYFKLTVAALLLCGLISRCACTNCSDISHKPLESGSSDTIIAHSQRIDRLLSAPRKPVRLTDADGQPVKHRVRGVGDYKTCFPDLNDVQLATAERLGISCIADRQAAQNQKSGLVYVGDNPLYRMHHLSHSTPYLVPRAARLLDEIARNFTDSLRVKGFPFYKLLITSVLRTEKDVEKLRRVNVNASENSCHRFGTTFDISYNSFYRVLDPESKEQRQVWPPLLKDILAEVLRDQRQLGTCYVKYEVHQACFHITAR